MYKEGKNANNRNSIVIINNEKSKIGLLPTLSLNAPKQGEAKNSKKYFKQVAVPKYSDARLLSSPVKFNNSVGNAGNTIVKDIEYKQKINRIGQ